ncbi:uncharacterized protein LOC121054978 [Oryza brachyantha]|uniref:uncharacterized protein LOC121054978 n=1 Tax=Oryza brachyantha TaxID=4533 RepID=UPI001ADD3373|nr:uncharacterized protein LOC121054978 [Oryza brachyantha]
MLQCQLPMAAAAPPRFFLAITRATSTTISLTPRAAAQNGRSRSRSRRHPKPKSVAFPPPPLRRLVSSSLRRLLPRPRPLTVGWFGLGGSSRRRRRATPAEELAALALSLALGDRLAVLADYWNASGVGQALGVWAAVSRRGGGRGPRGGLRRLAALLLGIAFCALVCHLRGASLVDALARTAGGRKLARIFLH